LMSAPLRYRGFLDRFEPYGWEPSTELIAHHVGLSPREVLRLDLNTSPLKPHASLRAIARVLPRIRVNLYPDTSYAGLRGAISEYTGHDAEAVIPTNGADEAIDIISRVFLEKGRRALASTPTYSYFRIATELQGGEYISVPRTEGFRDDVEGIIESVDGETSLIFLCSPNNPTGNITPVEDVERICRETEACVVVDEAYYEFCGITAQPLVQKYSNLIIVRTLSKAFGLASARIGYIISSPETVRLLNKARPPNSLGAVNIELAKHALSHREYMERTVKMVARERERVRERLSSMEGIEVYPSHANFLLVKFKDVDAGEVYKQLLRRGIVVRDMSKSPHTSNCLRVTISLRRDNERFLAALGTVLSLLRR